MSLSFTHITIRSPTPASVFGHRDGDKELRAPTHPSPVLQYAEVPAISQITLFKGNARTVVSPYSSLHARLTGYGGSPTPVSRRNGNEVHRDCEAQQNVQSEPFLLPVPIIEDVILKGLDVISKSATCSQELRWGFAMCPKWPVFRCSGYCTATCDARRSPRGSKASISKLRTPCSSCSPRFQYCWWAWS